MQVVTAARAVAFVRDGDTVLIGGSGGGHAVPERLIVALAERFTHEGHPRGLTSLHPVGIGDEDHQGVGRLAQPGLLRRLVCGSLIDSPPLEELARRDAIEAYTLPQGALSQLMREMAAGRPGLVSPVGLHTFVDPRHGGPGQSPSAHDELVELVTLAGREWLFYKPFHVDIAFLRGTTADMDGNVTMEHEAVFGEMLSMAQATRHNGGVVIVQVRRLAERRTLPAKSVKIPGILVDLVVVDPDQRQSYLTDYSPAFAGELRVPVTEITPLALDARKVIARRAALELFPGAICNLGSGVSTGLAAVAAEECVLDRVVLTNEQGLIGGAPASGVEAGAGVNYAAMIDQPYQFDFYDGGGLDLAFLSFAQVDASGNVNVSRFGERIIGVGGFINISQNARRVVFSGTFTAGGLELDWPDGRTRILREGRAVKFVDQVQQLTFNSAFSRQRGQQVLYVTERAVFHRGSDGPELVEVAPGLDVERDILAHMHFRPRVADGLREMDPRLFRPQPMGLVADIDRHAAQPRAQRVAELWPQQEPAHV
jgi:propionate CoA-transferase